MRFLPPYSPDLNPIKMAFSKPMALMRTKADVSIATSSTVVAIESIWWDLQLPLDYVHRRKSHQRQGFRLTLKGFDR